MFGRRQRREERLYWEGFRDALVHGVRDPSKPEDRDFPVPVAERPRYPRGFEDGLRAAKRIHRDALVSEVSKLSLKPGATVVVKLTTELTTEMARLIRADLEPRFPDNEILILEPGLELSVVRPESIVVKTVLDGKVIGEAVAKLAEDSAARS